jgi:hypothetical protein
MLAGDGVKLHRSALSEAINPYTPPVQGQLQQLAGSIGAQTYQSQLVAERVLDARVTTQALVLSFEDGFRWVALAMALGLVLVLLLEKPAAGPAPIGAH